MSHFRKSSNVYRVSTFGGVLNADTPITMTRNLERKVNFLHFAKCFEPRGLASRHMWRWSKRWSECPTLQLVVVFVTIKLERQITSLVMGWFRTPITPFFLVEGKMGFVKYFIQTQETLFGPHCQKNSEKHWQMKPCCALSLILSFRGLFELPSLPSY